MKKSHQFEVFGSIFVSNSIFEKMNHPIKHYGDIRILNNTKLSVFFNSEFFLEKLLIKKIVLFPIKYKFLLLC